MEEPFIMAIERSKPGNKTEWPEAKVFVIVNIKTEWYDKSQRFITDHSQEVSIKLHWSVQQETLKYSGIVERETDWNDRRVWRYSWRLLGKIRIESKRVVEDELTWETGGGIDGSEW